MLCGPAAAAVVDSEDGDLIGCDGLLVMASEGQLAITAPVS